MTQIQTLCLIIKDGKLLLGMKKRGFGAGRWNGFGGKLEPNESIEESLVRELKEETGLVATKIEKMGVLTFKGVIDDIIENHLFEIVEYSGEPKESEEMKPKWFDFGEIPYGSMWPDDTYWLPHFLQGKRIIARFDYEAGKIINHKINEVKSFEKMPQI